MPEQTTEQKAVAAFSKGVVYAATEKDALELVGPILDIASTVVLYIPAPFGEILAVVLSGASSGWNGIRHAYKSAITGSAKYLPLNVADKVTAKLKDMPMDWWEAAAKDKFAQWTHDGAVGISTAVRISVQLTGFNVDCTYRFADLVYNHCIACGAQNWQAAAVAASIVSPMVVGTDSRKNFHDRINEIAGKPNAWTEKTGDQWWNERVKQQGGVAVNAKDASKLLSASDATTTKGGDGNALIGIGAAALLAKVLL